MLFCFFFYLFVLFNFFLRVEIDKGKFVEDRLRVTSESEREKENLKANKTDFRTFFIGDDKGKVSILSENHQGTRREEM